MARQIVLIVFACAAFAGVPLNTVAIVSTSGSSQGEFPVTVRRAFRQGEISQYPQVGLCTTSACTTVSSWLTTQADVQARWFEPIGAVTAATNASPVAVTMSKNHGLTTGARVRIFGGRGNTAVNGEWLVTVTGATTFTLDGSTGNGTYSGGGSASSNQNGSVQQALVTWWIPSGLTAGETKHFLFRNQTTGNNTGFLDKAGILAFNESSGGAADGWQARIQAIANSETKNSDARAMVNALPFSDGQLEYWAQGSVLTAVIVRDQSPARSYDFGWNWNGTTMAADMAEWTVSANTLTDIMVTGTTATAVTVSVTSPLAVNNSITVFGCANAAFNGTYVVSSVTAMTIVYTVPSGLSGQTCANAGAGIRSHRYKSASPAFVLWFYSQGATRRLFVEYRAENLWDNSVQMQQYTNFRFQHGTTGYTSWWDRTNQLLLNHSRIHKWSWNTVIAAAPLYRVDHNKEYLMYTRLVPAYDFNWALSTAGLASAYNTHATKGDQTSCAAIPCTAAEEFSASDLSDGGEEARLLTMRETQWLGSNFDTNSTNFLIGWDANGRGYQATGIQHGPGYTRNTRGQTNLFCPTSCRAGNNTKIAFGRVRSKESEGTWQYQTTGVTVGTFRSTVNGDIAHVIWDGYLPALLTGLWGHYEDAMIHAGGMSTHSNVGDDDGDGGKQSWSWPSHTWSEQRRSLNQFRGMMQGAILARDGTPEKEYFGYKVFRFAEITEGLFGVTSGSFPPVDATCASYNRTTNNVAWCWGYYTQGGWEDSTATDTLRRPNPLGMWELGLNASGSRHDYGQGAVGAGATPILNYDTTSYYQSPWYGQTFRSIIAWGARMGFPLDHARAASSRYFVDLERNHQYHAGTYNSGARVRSAVGVAPANRDNYPQTWSEHTTKMTPVTLWNQCHDSAGTSNFTYTAPAAITNTQLTADDNSDFSSPAFNQQEYCANCSGNSTRYWMLFADVLVPATSYYFRAEYTTSVAGGTLTSISVSGGTATVNFAAAHNQVTGSKTVTVSGASESDLNGAKTCSFTSGGSTCTYSTTAAPGTYTTGISAVVRAQNSGPVAAAARRNMTSYCQVTTQSGYIHYALGALASSADIVTPSGAGWDAYWRLRNGLASASGYPQMADTSEDPTQYLVPAADPPRVTIAPADTRILFSIEPPKVGGYSTSDACTVIVDDNSDYATPLVNTSDGGGASLRIFEATGLTASTLYYTRVRCTAADIFGSGNTDGTATTLATLTGTATLSVTVGPGDATRHLDHGTTSSLGSTVTDSACASGCTLSATGLTKGVRYLRVRGTSTGGTSAVVLP